MKCKICRKTFRTLPAMAAHYRKKHPSKMKVKRSKKTSKDGDDVKALLKKLLAKL